MNVKDYTTATKLYVAGYEAVESRLDTIRTNLRESGIDCRKATWMQAEHAAQLANALNEVIERFYGVADAKN